MTASTFRIERPSIEQTTTETNLSPFRAVLCHGPLTSTVPRELVHRAAVAEVMLTDWRRLEDTRFAMTAQWPRGHSFFTLVEGTHHDPLIAAETIRQAGALLAHAEFGVPFGHQFLLEEMALTVHPDEVRIGHAPAALDLDVTCTEVRRRGCRLAGMRYETTVRREGRIAASGRISFSVISPAVYRRLRPQRVFDPEHCPIGLTAPVAPQTVGRLSPADVVLSPTGDTNRWQLRVDTRHPVLFDHQVDHVPGMVLLEAARQAATAVLGRPSVLPLGLACEFTKYAELDRPCLIDALHLPKGAHGAPDTVLVTGHQDGEPVFSTTMTAASGT
ncbi:MULTISPECIES: ScbA/BarX family gamma-butyrolactone biosynthesis protein [Streptomyces]|uniref:ScbA/BarX family gamma-butyrolactone biosynthesis protein n=1 Tax=Streptomyces TaxID=1883 RepID=UPI001CE33595|nr:ScbA/BarX family gamma-butyrolactone biosynthesis protein [Streptomyces solaniscabiei]